MMEYFYGAQSAQFASVEIPKELLTGKKIYVEYAIDRTDKYGRTLAYLYTEGREKYHTEQTSFIYVAVNAHWEEHRFSLPVLPEGFQWRLAFEAYGVRSEPGEEKILNDQTGINLGPRTTAVLIGNH